MHRTRRWAQAAAVLACGALVVTGCSKDAEREPGKADAPKAPSGLEQYYSQQLDWVGCGTDFSTGSDDLGNLECAWLTVPMDYDSPDGDTIKIAVARSVAKDSQRSVVVNPGGPGASGIDYAAGLAGAGLPLADVLNLVGFDPRGVERSTPLDCLDTDDLGEYLSADIDLSTEAGLEARRQEAAEFGQACQKRTGAMLAHVDTISAARDLDVLRAALGEDTLTYFGASYGTKLGATYAALFPERVGRMVLDGAVDPTLTWSDLDLGQIEGMDSALRAFVEACLSQGEAICPLSGSVDEAMAQVVDVVETATATPLSTGTEHDLTGELALLGILNAMYSQSYWPDLAEGLAEAINDNSGSVLFRLAVDYLALDSNQYEANISINCLDVRGDADPQALADEAARIQEVAPVLGKAFVHAGKGYSHNALGCAEWPIPAVGPLESYTAKGAPPIVVIGTTNDPATPYKWAQALATMLDSGVLVTREGEGHCAYTSGNACVMNAVDEYLINGTVPKDGLTC